MSSIESMESDFTPAEEYEQKPRRRGRPRVTPAFFDENAPMLFGFKSRRTEVKRYRGLEVMTLLNEQADGAKRFAYITGPDTRWEILAELGQFTSTAKILEAATTICELELKVKDAVAILRWWRTEKASPGDPVALGREIERLIRNYKLRHPATSNEQIHDALEIVGEDYPLEE